MLLQLIAASVKDAPVVHAGKAIALALGIGAGAAGAGAGIGNIFGSMIQSVARQPELRGELQGIQWLGFALTEAVVFYGFLVLFIGTLILGFETEMKDVVSGSLEAVFTHCQAPTLNGTIGVGAEAKLVEKLKFEVRVI